MIFDKSKLFLIAEAGINHNGKIKQAIKLIDSAKRSGANAIKFQTYKTERRTKKNSPIFDILKKCELKYSEFKILNDYCHEKKIIFFSTPFDLEAIDFLESIKVKLYKISSFDIENYQLIKKIIDTKKPCVFSTGMSGLKTIKKTFNLFKKKKIETSILHCISSYPTKEQNSLLSNIEVLKNFFDTSIGLSDHTPHIRTSLYSYLLGARVIEKHFRINENHNCVDANVSITEKQMKQLIIEINQLKIILGKPKFGLRKVEKDSKIFKRKKIY